MPQVYFGSAQSTIAAILNDFIFNEARHVKTVGFSPWLCNGGDSQPHKRGW